MGIFGQYQTITRHNKAWTVLIFRRTVPVQMTSDLVNDSYAKIGIFRYNWVNIMTADAAPGPNTLAAMEIEW